MTNNKPKILLGITGCIAAYKACEIIRLLQSNSCEVRVVTTRSALEFVGVATFDALTGYSTLTNTFEDLMHPIPHIELANWCDAFLIAPCTANVCAKITHGIADDLLTATALAAWSKLIIAPAMNTHMYEAPATQDNLSTLTNRGVSIIEPESGLLACGDVGKGHLADVNTIVEETLKFANNLSYGANNSSNSGNARNSFDRQHTHRNCLAGKRVLITAGPTHEKIDDVRYIGNNSSGKMGYALAEAAINSGAQVTLVSGPVSIEPPTGANIVNITSADQMLTACKDAFPNIDIAILAAAVADYRPRKSYSGKLKKENDDELLSTIDMERTPDILATLSSIADDNQYVVGFALENNDLENNARNKLKNKGANMIVANPLCDGTVFGSDNNSATIITKDKTYTIPETTKENLANNILNAIYDNID